MASYETDSVSQMSGKDSSILQIYPARKDEGMSRMDVLIICVNEMVIVNIVGFHTGHRCGLIT